MAWVNSQRENASGNFNSYGACSTINVRNSPVAYKVRDSAVAYKV